jgi:hypothetical protein
VKRALLGRSDREAVGLLDKIKGLKMEEENRYNLYEKW